MAEKIATRNAYGDAIVALAEQYPELVVLDADLSGATMSKGFSKAYPERFFNMGIASELSELKKKWGLICPTSML